MNASLLKSIIYAKDGAPGAIRTRDLSLRRRILYPAELRAHIEILATSVSTRRSAFGHALVTPPIRHRSALFQAPDSTILSARFEPLLDFFGGQYSIQLSYGRIRGWRYYLPGASRVQRALNPCRENPHPMAAAALRTRSESRVRAGDTPLPHGRPGPIRRRLAWAYCLAYRIICVQRNSASVLPVSLWVTMASQTWVVLPRCTAFALPTMVPSRAVPK